MEKTPRNVWYHSKFYGAKTYFNGEDGSIVARSQLGDFYLYCLFTFDSWLYMLFDLSFFPKEGLPVEVINREITDKDWATIQEIINNEMS